MHGDRLDSTRLITDTTGTVADTYAYDAYGNTTAHTGSIHTNLQYNGQFQDSESNLYYLRARYYDPTTTQFTTLDPLAATTGDRYSYAAGNPLTFTDPTGLCAWWLWQCGGAIDDLKASAANVFVNFGRGASGGLTDVAADAISPGASCTVTSEGAQAAASQVLGNAATRISPMGGVSAAMGAVSEGIYVVRTANGGVYVGQSGDVEERLKQHVYNGKFTQAEMDAAERIAVSGGKIDREIAEQLKLDSVGGRDGAGVVNRVNPIGPRRLGHMPSGYSRP